MALVIESSAIAETWIVNYNMLAPLQLAIEKVRAMGLKKFKVGVEKYDPTVNLYRCALYFEGYEETDREENGYLFFTTIQEDPPGTAEKALKFTRVEFQNLLVDGTYILSGRKGAADGD